MPSALRRVLFIASAYPRFEGDVITPWLGTTIARLRDAGIDVEVLAPAFHGSSAHVISGVRVHRFRYAPASWEMLSHDHPIPWQLQERPIRTALVPGYLVACAAAATRLAGSERYDVIHAFWPLPHALPAMVARLIHRVPLVSTFFGAELHWLARRSALARVAVRAIVAQSEVVTAISTFTARSLVAIAPAAQPVVIPFGAAAAPASAGHNDGPPPFLGTAQFLFVGRLVARKGIDVLLYAMAQLHDPAITLTIIGEGAERASLQALAETLGLASRVTFTGYLPQGEMEATLQACDTLVLPAVTHEVAGTEGLGVVLIEALGYGRPVIASDVGGIPDVVSHERTGLLVPPGDVDALAAAMRRLATDPPLARSLGVAGRACARAHFSWEGIVSSLASVYDQAISRRAP